MGVNPVWLQGMVQRSQDATSIKAFQDSKPQIDQTNLMGNHIKELHQKQENVIKKDDVEYNEYRYDAKEKSRNGYNGKQQKKKKREEDADGKVVVKDKSGKFDVSI